MLPRVQKGQSRDAFAVRALAVCCCVMALAVAVTPAEAKKKQKSPDKLAKDRSQTPPMANR